ncbi:class I SAM-dependent methyltransferase [Candidatus Saccharibacteria bacterium]|nr:class I SAM-dependent methyltransferase [Candidatus Saccharibacteria bacterium]
MCFNYDDSVIATRERVTCFKPIQDLDINERFFHEIAWYLYKGYRILDIGTGNGYVLKELIRRNHDLALEFYGVDNSAEMVKAASEELGDYADIVRGSAERLPFRDETFEVVTAKNVTRINMREVYRVLKHGGVFVFREYGTGKGLCEVTKLFPGRVIRQREPEYYKRMAEDAGLSVIRLNSYLFTRKYDSAEDIVTIVRSFPLIQDFGEADEQLIIESCRDATVSSDPFIMVCKKEF